MNSTVRQQSVTDQGLSQGVVLLMAVAAGLYVASIYYCQPMLGILARDFHTGPEGVAQVAVLTQMGYALGLLFLASLGDCMERRRLIVITSTALALALAGAALAPSLGVLTAASLAIGVLGSVAQQVVPMAAHLAPDHRRGQVIGTVMAGVLSGILLARTVSGVVSEYAGWREMFALSAVACLLMGGVLALRLPRTAPRQALSYPQVLASLGRLLRTHGRLRSAGVIQGLLFAAFVAFWSNLALYMERPPFLQGSAMAGLLGILGAAGVLAAPLAGRLADKSNDGGRRVVASGTLAVTLAFGLMGLAQGSWPALLAGIVLMDVGLQMSMISNQSRVYALDAEARSRLNTVYMTIMFLAGAAGAEVGALAFASHGWSGVCVMGGVCGLGAWILEMTSRQPRAVRQ